tara:strand:- start:299 stop:1540 length:1242 start_codon:yes stop_codon:yes gene_type:complete
MKIKTLEDIYNNEFLADETFINLEKKLVTQSSKKSNIFEILKIKNMEIRHSNFLGWLLDPEESHNLENEFLKGFVQEGINKNKYTEITVDIDLIDSVKIEREYKDIDLLIESHNVVFCIENKIFSNEHSDQLKKYKKIVQKEFPNKEKVFIYLTPSGKPSQQETELYLPISYSVVLEVLKHLNIKKIDKNAQIYILDYIAILEKDILKNNELKAPLSKLHLEYGEFIKQILEKRNTSQSKEREIYKKHQEFFDYFSKNNFDPEWISLLIQKTLLKNGYKLGSINSKYVRFYPVELEPYIYKSKQRNTWEHREIFIFELEIKEKNKIAIRSCVNRRGDEDFDYDGLLKIIDTIPNAKQRNKDWVFSHEKEFPIDYLKIAKLEESSAINDLEKIFKSYKDLFIDKYIQTFSNTNR